jgi:A/G-specific adenine glycosylase
MLAPPVDHGVVLTGPTVERAAGILPNVPDSTTTPSAVPPATRAAILAWYRRHGRDLAFRRTTDPYAILVSEAMAQQTQAARAAEAWQRFMVRFPTVDALAAATPADVIRAWAGLGYDRRAVALWRSAGIIVDRHGGSVPSSIDDLEALPGVGPYTARAVAAIAFGQPVGAVDVNVRRVLGRLVAGSADALRASDLQAMADASVPRDEAAAWTHALMDIGALVCRPREPRCPACPARSACRLPASQGLTATPATDGPAVARPAPGHPTALGVARRGVPFASTDRWLRGRILDRARAVDDDSWIELDGPIGEHALARVRAAASAMASDGVLELERRADTRIRARLPLAGDA